MSKYGYNPEEYFQTKVTLIDKDGFHKDINEYNDSSRNNGYDYLIDYDEIETGSVLFIDYDGSIIATYTTEEIANLSSLPANPQHEGLISQGWNWKLDRIKYYMAKYPKCILTVGQMYNTEDRATHIYLNLFNDLEVSLVYIQNAENATYVDWGDGSLVESSSNNGKVIATHTYSSKGEYIIKIKANDNTTVTFGYSENIGTNTQSFITVFNNDDYNNKYYDVKKIHFADNVILNYRSFVYCCHALTALTLPRGIVMEYDEIFVINNLKSIIIPDTITQIMKYTFNTCNALNLLSIPEETTQIENNAFVLCQSLKFLTLSEGTSVESYAFNGCKSLLSLTLPEGVSVGTGAFAQCESLISLTLADGISNIGQAAFSGCSSLKSIEIPNSITNIDTSVFAGCVKLKIIKMKDNIVSINSRAFDGCASLNTVELPASITSIASTAFTDCINLLNIYIKADIPPTIASDSFSRSPSNVNIYVPAESIDAYKTENVWSNHADYIQALPED